MENISSTLVCILSRDNPCYFVLRTPVEEVILIIETLLMNGGWKFVFMAL